MGVLPYSSTLGRVLHSYSWIVCLVRVFSLVSIPSGHICLSNDLYRVRVRAHERIGRSAMCGCPAAADAFLSRHRGQDRVLWLAVLRRGTVVGRVD